MIPIGRVLRTLRLSAAFVRNPAIRQGIRRGVSLASSVTARPTTARLIRQSTNLISNTTTRSQVRRTISNIQTLRAPTRARVTNSLINAIPSSRARGSIRRGIGVARDVRNRNARGLVGRSIGIISNRRYRDLAARGFSAYTFLQNPTLGGLVTRGIGSSINLIADRRTREIVRETVNTAIVAREAFKFIQRRSRSRAQNGTSSADWEAYYNGTWRDIHPNFHEDITKDNNIITRCVRWDSGEFRSYRNDRGLKIRKKEKLNEALSNILRVAGSLSLEPTRGPAYESVDARNTRVHSNTLGGIMTAEQLFQELTPAEMNTYHSTTSVVADAAAADTSIRNLMTQSILDDRSSGANLFNIGQDLANSNWITQPVVQARRIGL